MTYQEAVRVVCEAIDLQIKNTEFKILQTREMTGRMKSIQEMREAIFEADSATANLLSARDLVIEIMGKQ